MEPKLTDYKEDLSGYNGDKLSTRSSVFAWLLCALLGWALAFTSFYSLIGEDSEMGVNKNGILATDAQNMEKIIPAAGDNDPK